NAAPPGLSSTTRVPAPKSVTVRRFRSERTRRLRSKVHCVGKTKPCDLRVSGTSRVPFDLVQDSGKHRLVTWIPGRQNGPQWYGDAVHPVGGAREVNTGDRDPEEDGRSNDGRHVGRVQNHEGDLPKVGKGLR